MTVPVRPATLADTHVPLRQVLAHGQVRDAVTGRALEVAEVALRWRAGAGADAPGGALPVRLARRAGGWFALHLDVAVAMPDLAAAAADAGLGAVTLTAEVTARGRAAVEVSRDVPAADLVVDSVPVDVIEAAPAAARVRGAPVDLSTAVEPLPVGLRGVVLRDHDPDEPVAGATVAVTGGPTVTTDGRGRFVVAALPLAAAVEVTVSHDADSTTVTVRPDYDRDDAAPRVEHLTVSVRG